MTHARGWLTALALATLGSAAQPRDGALQVPLERPAIAVRDVQRSLMLALAQTGPRVVAVGERGVVLLSDDGGASWRQAANVPVSVTLTAVQFVDARTGWAVGHQGVVLRTDDAGEHWTRQLDGLAIARLMLEDAQANAGTKATAEAQRSLQDGADKPLLALHFVNEREGLVAGAFNLLLATSDGGRSWQAIASRLDNPKASHLYAIHREAKDVLITGEQGLLLHSADGGAHFDRIPTPYRGSFFVAAREADGAWLLAGLRGNALRSTDAGQNWTALANPAPASMTAALQGTKGATWLVNQAGQLLTLDAGAAGFKVAVQTPAQQPSGLLRLADGTLLVAGWNGITRVRADPR